MAKGYTAEEVVGRFVSGIEGAGEKWEERTRAGMERYRDWIEYWYYPCLGAVAAAMRVTDPWERSKKVGTFTQTKAKAYRAEKVRKLAALARRASPSPSPA